MTAPPASRELHIQGEVTNAYREVLTVDAMSLVADLVRKFAPERRDLLANRQRRQQAFDAGALPDFLEETKDIRNSDWQIRGIPEDLLDRRVEITGPVERKMVINALNADVKVFMADFEDSLSPTWNAVVQGQINLRDAVNRNIDYIDPNSGKHYQLSDDPAVLICRVRGLHLDEKHVLFQGEAIPGALFDFALYFLNNYRQLLNSGSGPYFYIPKLQSHHEAAWWSRIFSYVEDRYCLERGTIKATLLIETLPAVFEMNEILYAMKDHIVALNCGRWDYIFSYIKTLKNHSDRVLPDRQQVGMAQPFLNAYSRLLIRTCHRRGAMAMGGMAAFIPSKDAEQNEAVLEKVRQDKEREANNGHDGTWIAHPGLAATAQGIFSRVLGQRKNQLDISREEDAEITADDLLQPCEGTRTEAGMRLNIRIAVQYIEAWISGNGCVPIYGLMEDAATAEICRTSIWQWIRHGKALDSGEVVTPELFTRLLSEEMLVLAEELGDIKYRQGRFEEAAALMEKITLDEQLVEFLTLPGYRRLN
ncbi:malate synthase A [Corallincola luteus]|uniref:malate synthase n=1 Tax=Corallincola luteus TaxID=1775177 RepID=A0ABY2ARE5_9GAMM|nr:malate synthase A [Corallincola luteus]TCI05656.1 malate synthase A [Corallincola luteus]